MKHYLILLALLFAGQAWGQVELPPAREVDKEYRKDYRKEVKEYNRTEKRLTEENWDVVLGPGESVPTDVISAEAFRTQAYSNWYRDLVSPEGVAADMVQAAKRKGLINITDTGCDTDHPDLQKGKIKGSNYTADPCLDIHGHSSHVTGIAYLICKPLIDAGYIDVKLSKFLGDKGQGSFGAITGGVDEETAYMVDNYLSYGKFAIGNGSWGGGTSVYSPLKTALQKSRAADVVWMFAAGNSGGPVIFPGLLPEVNAVSSLDQSLNLSSFSCRGPEVDFSAGGRNIYSTLPGGRYGSLSGTSMATPALTGVAAVAMCVHPSLTAETLPAYLAEVSQDLGEPDKDDLYGWGMTFVRAILDNPPGGQPDPPTCEDGKQNGDETGIDCGGSCPPCEVPGPEKPPYKKRKMDVILDGAWVLGWWRTGAANTSEPIDYDLDATALVSPAGMTQIKISRIGYEVASETTFDWEYKALEDNAALFFRNRAIGTPEGWDIADAGRYVPFFLDYFTSNASDGYRAQDLRPILVEFEWEGVRVTLGPDKLVDYKK